MSKFFKLLLKKFRKPQNDYLPCKVRGFSVSRIADFRGPPASPAFSFSPDRKTITIMEDGIYSLVLKKGSIIIPEEQDR